MRTSVLKFGGSSFLELGDYHRVARFVAERLKTDSDRVALVVSAMSGTTGRLQEAVLRVHGGCSSRVLDEILSTGELVSAALMQAALEAAGISCESLNGLQVGFSTDSNHCRANVLSIDGAALKGALARSRVVVVSGGQGRSDEGKMTMLGRNSSDLSAILVAGALGAGACEIYSDLPGVYSADPYEVEGTAMYRTISYADCMRLSGLGVKVIHHGAVRWARDLNVAIDCRRLDASGTAITGTTIGARGEHVRLVAIEKQALRVDAEGVPGLEALLRSANVNHRRSGRQVFVLEPGFRLEALKQIPGLARAPVEPVCLLIAFESGVEADRFVVCEEANLRIEAQRLHGELMGPAWAAPEAPRLEKKERSRHSGLLVG